MKKILIACMMLCLTACLGSTEFVITDIEAGTAGKCRYYLDGPNATYFRDSCGKFAIGDTLDITKRTHDK
jgi:hypothetical protein